jgi:hypothetical protein
MIRLLVALLWCALPVYALAAEPPTSRTPT